MKYADSNEKSMPLNKFLRILKQYKDKLDKNTREINELREKIQNLTERIDKYGSGKPKRMKFDVGNDVGPLIEFKLKAIPDPEKREFLSKFVERVLCYYFDHEEFLEEKYLVTVMRKNIWFKHEKYKSELIRKAFLYYFDKVEPLLKDAMLAEKQDSNVEKEHCI